MCLLYKLLKSFDYCLVLLLNLHYWLRSKIKHYIKFIFSEVCRQWPRLAKLLYIKL